MRYFYFLGEVRSYRGTDDITRSTAAVDSDRFDPGVGRRASPSSTRNASDWDFDRPLGRSVYSGIHFFQRISYESLFR